MKTAKDPRHQVRREAVKALFAESFTHQRESSDLVKKILSQKNVIDRVIEKAAPSWPIDKLNKIDLAILRLAIYEMGNPKTPPKVIIDEAVELAKEFGSEASPSFVNGALGTVYKDKEKTTQTLNANND
jgi:N utilization substance protein B